jgi:hypothetical protein
MADEYNVTMSYNNEIDVTLESATNTQVSTSYVVAESLEDLGNVDTSALDKTGNTTNNYVMVWDASAQKYKFVNPDVVLNTAASETESISPGLPQPFIDALDVELDNLIDVDGGGF